MPCLSNKYFGGKDTMKEIYSLQVEQENNQWQKIDKEEQNF